MDQLEPTQRTETHMAERIETTGRKREMVDVIVSKRLSRDSWGTLVREFQKLVSK